MISHRAQRRPRPRLTYANAVATLALFVALGGTGYAAVSLPKGSVGTAQLKKEAITATKIKNGAVTAAKLAPGAIPGTEPAQTVDHARTADRAALADRATAADRADRSAVADNAAHATSADRAETAEFAAGAGDAQTLGGRSLAEVVASSKLACPAGTEPSAGICFEEAERPPADLFVALQTCAKAGRFLPSVSMLMTFETEYYTYSPASEWAGQSYYIPGSGSSTGSRGQTATAFQGQSFSLSESVPAGSANPFRCASLPGN